MKANNQIMTEAQLQIVLNAVADYYRFNACTDRKPNDNRCLTVSKLLTGAIEFATLELQEHKNGGAQ